MYLLQLLKLVTICIVSICSFMAVVLLLILGLLLYSSGCGFYTDPPDFTPDAYTASPPPLQRSARSSTVHPAPGAAHPAP